MPTAFTVYCHEGERNAATRKSIKRRNFNGKCLRVGYTT